jgi:hypothetical protein
LGSRHANATVFQIEVGGIIGSFVLVTCLTISPSPYDAARGLSIASVTSPVSNTASKGNCLTSTHRPLPAQLHNRNEQQQGTAGKFWSDVKLPSASSLIGLISGQLAALLR